MTVNTIMINMQIFIAWQNEISNAVLASLIGILPAPYQCMALSTTIIMIGYSFLCLNFQFVSELEMKCPKKHLRKIIFRPFCQAENVRKGPSSDNALQNSFRIAVIWTHENQ